MGPAQYLPYVLHTSTMAKLFSSRVIVSAMGLFLLIGSTQATQIIRRHGPVQGVVARKVR